ncbi:hypothetical protein HC928_10375, partial [bacterium]|nr:hypothetical protein [bacterium]
MVKVPLLRRVLTLAESVPPVSGMQQAVPLTWLEGVPLGEVYAVRVETWLLFDGLVNQGDVLVIQRQYHLPKPEERVLVVLPPQQAVRLRTWRLEGDAVVLAPLLPALPA